MSKVAYFGLSLVLLFLYSFAAAWAFCNWQDGGKSIDLAIAIFFAANVVRVALGMELGEK